MFHQVFIPDTGQEDDARPGTSHDEDPMKEEPDEATLMETDSVGATSEIDEECKSRLEMAEQGTIENLVAEVDSKVISKLSRSYNLLIEELSEFLVLKRVETSVFSEPVETSRSVDEPEITDKDLQDALFNEAIDQNQSVLDEQPAYCPFASNNTSAVEVDYNNNSSCSISDDIVQLFVHNKVKATLFENDIFLAIDESVRSYTDDDLAPGNAVNDVRSLNMSGIDDENDKYNCYCCLKSFKTKNQLKVHNKGARCKKNTALLNGKVEKTVDSAKRQWACDVCQECFTRKNDYKVHMKTHRDLKYKCPECLEGFKCSKTRNRHMKLVHGKKRQALETIAADKTTKHKKCPSCSEEFPTTYKLLRHNKQVHSAKPDPKLSYECPFCGSQYKATSLNLHLESKHGVKNHERKLITCELCDKTYLSPASLVIHAFDIHGQKVAASRFEAMRETPTAKLRSPHISCSISLKRLSTVVLEKIHGTRVNVDSGCKCGHCDLSFDSLESYIHHLKETHDKTVSASEIEAYKNILPKTGVDKVCPVCSKKFSSVRTLDNHLARTHNIKVSTKECQDL